MGAENSKTGNGMLYGYPDAYKVHYKSTNGFDSKVEIQKSYFENGCLCESFSAIYDTEDYHHDDQDNFEVDEHGDWMVVNIKDQGPIPNENIPILQHDLQVSRSLSTNDRSVSFYHIPDQENKVSIESNSVNWQKQVHNNHNINRPNTRSNRFDENHDEVPRKPSPAFSMESFMSGISTSTNATLMSTMCDDSTPLRIQTSLKHNPRSWILTVGVKQAECSLSARYRDRKVYWQIHITLLPHRTQRRKTKYKSTQTPIFNQSFDIPDVPKSALSQMSVRYRMYARFKRVGRKRVVGEVQVDLGELLDKSNCAIDGEWHTMTNILPQRSRSISY